MKRVLSIGLFASLALSPAYAQTAATSGHSPAVTAPVIPLPVFISQPVITGTAQEGQTLTADTGSISGAVKLTYQWNWADVTPAAPISGATAPTYVPVASDIGHTISVTVTAYSP